MTGPAPDDASPSTDATTAKGEVGQRERAALVALFESTGGERWTKQDHWLSMGLVFYRTTCLFIKLKH